VRHLNYPPARRDNVVDDYHGVRIADPYRWLEDPDHDDTRSWVTEENDLTEAFLAEVPSREALRARLTELWDYPRFAVPFERGGRWFQMRSSGLQNQPVLYVAPDPDEEGRPLLDPNTLSVDGTVAITGLSVSEDGSLAAYSTSAAGSDWQTWRVRDVSTGLDRPDLIEWSKFSSAAWRGDASGFYYAALPRPEAGRELDQENRFPRILFHHLGHDQSDDVEAFAAPDEPDWLPDVAVSDDDQYLIISIQRGTNPESQVRVLSLARPDLGYRTLVGGFTGKAVVVGNVGATFFVLSDEGAGRGRIVTVDLGDPDPGNWIEVVPEGADTLVEAYLFGGTLVTHHLRDAHSVLRVHELDGTPVGEIPLPGPVSVTAGGSGGSAVEGRWDADMVRFRVASFIESGALWSHNLVTGATEQERPSAAAVDAAAFVTDQVFVPAADGVTVPMFLTHRRDLVVSGDLPVILYGYGGFDVPMTPTFSLPMMVWLERGGVFAVASLPGGGEYGRDWYDAGRLANKQQVFDAFCAGARWLQDSGWTTPSRTAILGGSNGGLLVGACLTQHPELFGAVIGDVGVYDMLRFHRFTIGWAWTSDYGSSDDPEQFGWLRAYSPLHNVRSGTCYPATLLLTGDHDDRVVPGHSLKFAATLQHAQGCDAPVLLRVETGAGHGAGKPVAKLIAESTDRLTFLDAVLQA
jgi:prolyl oligopeptidase